jgi:hypothetical protein
MGIFIRDADADRPGLMAWSRRTGSSSTIWVAEFAGLH